MNMKLLVVITLICGLAASEDVTDGGKHQPPILEILSETIQDFVPCLSPCVLANLTRTVDALEPCVNQSWIQIQDFYVNHNIKTYSDFYREAINKPEGGGLSPFCRFFDDSQACLLDAVDGLCGNGSAARLQTISEGLRSYANCEGDMLPFLQCMAHPDICDTNDPNVGYLKCLDALDAEINRDYLKDGHFTWAHFYQEAIVENKGLGFRILLTNLGTCLDTVVKTPPNCRVMRGHILPQVEQIRDFLDYSNSDTGTDALLCFAKPELHAAYTQCYMRLAEDVESAPLPNITPTSDLIHNDTVRDAWPSILLWSRSNYLSFTTCLKMGVQRHCGYKWSSEEVIRVTQPTDDLFTALRPTVKGPGCEALAPVLPSSGRPTSSGPALLTVLVALTSMYVVKFNQ